MAVAPLRAGADETQDFVAVEELSLVDLLDLQVYAAGKRAQDVAEIPASVVVVTRADIERYGYATLEDILRSIPNFYAVEGLTGHGKTFGVRGYWTANQEVNVLLLIDGVPQIGLIDRSSLTSTQQAIPVEAIDRIEVIRGPQNVVWGSGAFFGAVNIITRGRGTAQEPRTTVSGSLGLNSTRKVALASGGSVGDLEYSVAAQHYETAGPDIPLSQFIKGFQQNHEALGFRRANATSAGLLGMRQTGFHVTGKMDGLSVAATYANTAHGFSFARVPYTPAAYDTIFTLGTIGYERSVGEMLTATSRLSVSRLDRDVDYNWFSTNPEGPLYKEDIYDISNYHAAGYTAELNLLIRPTYFLDITLGAWWESTVDHHDMNDIPSFGVPQVVNRKDFLDEDDDVNVHAAFGRAEYAPFRWLTMVAGARLEHHAGYTYHDTAGHWGPDYIEYVYDYEDEASVHMAPSGALLFSLSDDHVIKAMYSQGLNHPSAWQIRNNTKAQDDLYAETLDAWELGYVSQPLPWLGINASLYYNVIDNLLIREIVFDDEGYRGVFTNEGRKESVGEELTVSTHPTTELRVEGSFVAQKMWDRSPDRENVEPHFSPEFLGYLKVSYELPANIGLSVVGTYVDGMHAQWDDTPVEQGDGSLEPFGRLGATVDDYVLVDATLRIDEILKTNAYATLRGTNLLDQKVRYPTTAYSRWADKGVVGEGISVLATVGLEF